MVKRLSIYYAFRVSDRQVLGDLDNDWEVVLGIGELLRAGGYSVDLGGWNCVTKEHGGSCSWPS